MASHNSISELPMKPTKPRGRPLMYPTQTGNQLYKKNIFMFILKFSNKYFMYIYMFDFGTVDINNVSIRRAGRRPTENTSTDSTSSKIFIDTFTANCMFLFALIYVTQIQLIFEFLPKYESGVLTLRFLCIISGKTVYELVFII